MCLKYHLGIGTARSVSISFGNSDQQAGGTKTKNGGRQSDNDNVI